MTVINNVEDRRETRRYGGSVMRTWCVCVCGM